MKTTLTPCMAFVDCRNVATTELTETHPILGRIPACKRCKLHMDRIEGYVTDHPKASDFEIKSK